MEVLSIRRLGSSSSFLGSSLGSMEEHFGETCDAKRRRLEDEALLAATSMMIGH